MLAQFKLDTGDSCRGINPCANAGNEPVQTDINNSNLPNEETLREAAAGEDSQAGDKSNRHQETIEQMKFKVSTSMP